MGYNNDEGEIKLNAKGENVNNYIFKYSNPRSERNVVIVFKCGNIFAFLKRYHCLLMCLNKRPNDLDVNATHTEKKKKKKNTILWRYLLDIEIRKGSGIAKDAIQNIRKLLTNRIMFRNKGNSI